MNPLFLIDFYKVGHVSQYPEDTTDSFSVAGGDSVTVLGCLSMLLRAADGSVIYEDDREEVIVR